MVSLIWTFGQKDDTDFSQTADSLCNLGKILFNACSYEEAIQAFKKSLSIEVTLSRRTQITYRLYNIGEAYYELCEYDSALLYFDSASVLVRDSLQLELRCRIFNQIGEAYDNLSQYDRALVFYNSSHVIACKIKDRTMEGTVLCNIGWAYDGLSDYDKALSYYDSALVIAHSTKNARLEGCIIRRRGTAYSILGQYDKALACYDSALAIARAEKDLKLEGRTLMGIGRVRCALGEYEKALACNNIALDIMRAVKDRVSQAYVLDCSGTAFQSLFQYDSALAYHRSALAIRRMINDKLGEGNTLMNMGFVYDYYYKYDKAIAYLDSALVIAKEIKNRSGVEIIFMSTGAIYDQLTRLDQALAYYDSALVIARDTKEKMKEGTILMYIGGIYNNLKLYDKALIYYDSARVVIGPLNIKDTEGMILIYTGAAYRALKQYERALGAYDSALAVMRVINDKRMEGVALHNLGCTYYDLGQADKAIVYLDSALVIANETSNKFRKAKILTRMGTIFCGREQYERALALYDSSLTIARDIEDKYTEGMTLNDIGYLYEQRSAMEKAISYYKRSIEVKESIREVFQRVDLKTYYIEAEKDVYQRLIMLLIMLGRYKEAFEYLERSRSQKLRKAYEHGEMVAHDQSLQKLLESVNFLVSEIKGVKNRYQTNQINKTECETTTSQLEGQLNQKMLDLKFHHPQLYNIMAPQHRTLKHIQEIIPGNILFLEFVPVGDNYIVLLLTKKGFLAQKIAEPKDSVDQWVMKALTSLKWFSPEAELDKEYSRLYQILIGPLEKEIAKFPNVVIIPYGILHYFPFHALRRQDKNGDLQYFVEWKRINYLPSASFLTDILIEEKPVEQTLLAFANADGSLPSTEIEVDSISQIFERSYVCRRDSATKERLINNCSDYRLLHLATHGVLDADPRFSYIVLAPPDEGNLTVREIFGLSGHFKKTSLVTLSACETAVEEDPEDAGMELTTLSNAFKVAGVPAIVATLWEIGDRSTAILMKNFYQNLKSKKVTKLEALRAAQLAMIRHPEYSHPYYWAPFILIGDWR